MAKSPENPRPAKHRPTTDAEWRDFVNAIFAAVDNSSTYVLATAPPESIAANNAHNEGVAEVADQLAELLRKYGFDVKKGQRPETDEA